MANFLDNVRGCLFDIEEFHSSLSFTSPSDALFTALYFKHRNSLHMQVFDDLFALFRHPNFFSDRMMFKGLEDIWVHVAEQRQTIMTIRNTKGEIDHSTPEPRLIRYPPIRKLIPELVAEYLDSHRLPFHHIDDDDFEACSLNRTLANMSAVNRSWAEATQRFCGRQIRIQLKDQDSLQPLLDSPAVGPWVQEMSISRPKYGQMENVRRLLFNLLVRCPNVKHLRLDISFSATEEGIGPFKDVMYAIGRLRRLESLWMGRTSGLCIEGLRKLIALIPSLHHLKSLGLDSIEWHNDKDTLIPTHAPQPPATLNALSLTHTGRETAILLPWLMRPEGENCITRLELSLSSMIRCWSSTPFFKPAFESCMTARVTILQVIVDNREEDVGLTLGPFTSLKVLSLCITKKDVIQNVDRKPVVLPPSITDFHLCLVDSSDHNLNIYALAMMKTNSNVRRMLFDSLQLYDDFEAYYEEANNYAAMNNVDFKVTTEGNKPHFLDL